jgi:hypothetical protein
VSDEGKVGSCETCQTMGKTYNDIGTHVPTPRVPTSIPKTSASRAFWTTAYRRMRSLFVREDSSRAMSVCGSYEYI